MTLKSASRSLLTAPAARTGCETRAFSFSVRVFSGIVYQLIYNSATVLHRLRKDLELSYFLPLGNGPVAERFLIFGLYGAI